MLTFDQVSALHERYYELGSLMAVERESGISRERIRKLFLAYGFAVDAMERRRLAMSREALLRRDEIVDLYKRHGHVDPVIAATGLTRWQVEAMLSEFEGRAVFQRRGEQVAYTREQRIEAIQLAAEICGEPLGRLAYRKLREERPDLGLPSELTIIRQFDDDWEEACRVADVQARPSPQRRRSDWIPREVCNEALRACRDALGHIPTYAEYQRWSDGKDVPRGVTIRAKNQGRWRKALASAFDELKEEVA